MNSLRKHLDFLSLKQRPRTEEMRVETAAGVIAFRGIAAALSFDANENPRKATSVGLCSLALNDRKISGGACISGRIAGMPSGLADGLTEEKMQLSRFPKRFLPMRSAICCLSVMRTVQPEHTGLRVPKLGGGKKLEPVHVGGIFSAPVTEFNADDESWIMTAKTAVLK